MTLEAKDQKLGYLDSIISLCWMMRVATWSTSKIDRVVGSSKQPVSSDQHWKELSDVFTVQD